MAGAGIVIPGSKGLWGYAPHAPYLQRYGTGSAFAAFFQRRVPNDAKHYLDFPWISNRQEFA